MFNTEECSFKAFLYFAFESELTWLGQILASFIWVFWGPSFGKQTAEADFHAADGLDSILHGHCAKSWAEVNLNRAFGGQDMVGVLHILVLGLGTCSTKEARLAPHSPGVSYHRTWLMLISGSWSRPRGTFGFRACFGGVTLTIAFVTGHFRAEIKEMVFRVASAALHVSADLLECMTWWCSGGLIYNLWLVIGVLKSGSLV